MRNIQFWDREKELEECKRIEKENFFLVVKGRRRIGKTALLRKAFPEATYIFVWPNKSLDWITAKVAEEYNLPSFKNFVDLVGYLLGQKKVIIIDEFQNFLSVDKSVYGEIQRLVDERKGDFLKLAVAGSSYSLMNRVLSSVASPLYGRRTAEITLNHLPIKDVFENSKTDIENFFKMWSVFEGVPYYYELVDQSPAEDNIKRLILSKNSILQEEGKAVLSVEFGQDSKTYNTVLTSIAEGKTKLNEIAGMFGNKKTEAIKYIDLLRKEFKLVRRSTPLLSDPRKSREGQYEIIDNFLEFWLYFMERNKDYVEQGRFREVERFFEENFNGFLGRKFEKFVTNLIENKIISLPFDVDKIGRQWGSIQTEPKESNQYEIDVVALDEEGKNIFFCECKWQDNVNTEKVLGELKEKSKFVNWNTDKRNEYYCIIAKSFAKKIKEENVFLFDLKDLEVALRR